MPLTFTTQSYGANGEAPSAYVNPTATALLQEWLVLTEVEPDDANVQLPTEATQKWAASPGGGFTPCGITGAGGKVHKAGKALAQPYARRPLTCAVVSVLGGRLEASLALTKTPTLGCGKRVKVYS